MRCNVKNMLHQAGEAAAAGNKRYGGTYNFSLHELAKNLRELHDRHKAGDAKAIDEFFEIYVFQEGEDMKGEIDAGNQNQNA